MSATNKTTYLQLPIFIGTDTPSWLGDWNNTMTAIDTAVNGANNAASNAQSTANSAVSKSDGNTKAITAMNAELETIKEAVQNYDQILDFRLVPVISAPNNLKTSSWCTIAQNTNKTISNIKGFANFLSTLSNPTTYTYTSESGTSTWYDIFTVEDNLYNLNQSSQPHYSKAITVCTAMSKTLDSSGNITNATDRIIRAWYDGATTHFGIASNKQASFLQNMTIVFDSTVFLSGSVYNPADPSEPTTV